MAVQEQRTDDSDTVSDSTSESDETLGSREPNTVVTSVTDKLHSPQPGEDVQWCSHSLRRYYERTPNEGVTHTFAWENGISVQYATPYFRRSDTNQFPAEVRSYEHQNCFTIMIRHGDTIVTVLLLGLVNDVGIRSYIHELHNQHRAGNLRQNTEMWGESHDRVESINMDY